MHGAREANARRGGNVIAQFAARPFGILVGHQTSANPFLSRPAYAEMAELPLDTNVLFMTIMATKMPFVGRG